MTKPRIYCSLCGKKRYTEYLKSLPRLLTGEGQKNLCFVPLKDDPPGTIQCYQSYIDKRSKEFLNMAVILEAQK